MNVVAVVGLGYVGLPLAVAFGKKFPTIGFDLSSEKVESYRRHLDPTGEVSGEDLRAASQLGVTTDPARLADADIIVVAVPTPVDDVRRPDFGPLVGGPEFEPAFLVGGVAGRHSLAPPTTIHTETTSFDKLRMSGRSW